MLQCFIGYNCKRKLLLTLLEEDGAARRALALNAGISDIIYSNQKLSSGTSSFSDEYQPAGHTLYV